jgi:drug/metabolite transporter (DMT)-like permease
MLKQCIVSITECAAVTWMVKAALSVWNTWQLMLAICVVISAAGDIVSVWWGERGGRLLAIGVFAIGGIAYLCFGRVGFTLGVAGTSASVNGLLVIIPAVFGLFIKREQVNTPCKIAIIGIIVCLLVIMMYGGQQQQPSPDPPQP